MVIEPHGNVYFHECKLELEVQFQAKFYGIDENKVAPFHRSSTS